MQTTLTGITPEKLDWLLLGGILYFFIMLVVHGFESFQKWKLRLTGTTSTEMLQSVDLYWQRETEASQGVAYKVFRRIASDVDEKTNQRGGQLPNVTDQEYKSLKMAFRDVTARN